MFYFHWWSTIACPLPGSSISLTKYETSPSTPNSFGFSFVLLSSADNEWDISAVPKKKPSTSAPILYGHSVLCKAHYFVEDITNMFVQEEVFPSKLKEVKVVPVYKSGNECDPCNCRPTSLLSIFSCIFEKMMYHGPKDVLDTNDVLFKSQCGFCEMHST